MARYRHSDNLEESAAARRDMLRRQRAAPGFFSRLWNFIKFLVVSAINLTIVYWLLWCVFWVLLRFLNFIIINMEISTTQYHIDSPEVKLVKWAVWGLIALYYLSHKRKYYY